MAHVFRQKLDSTLVKRKGVAEITDVLCRVRIRKPISLRDTYGRHSVPAMGISN